MAKVTLGERPRNADNHVVAGQTAVARKGREGRRNRLKDERGYSSLEKEKPLAFGMIQRCGEVLIRMLENLRQVAIASLIRAVVSLGTVTDSMKSMNVFRLLLRDVGTQP